MGIVDRGGSGMVRAGRAGLGRVGRRARPVAEILEGRQLLATIMVNSAGDADGADGSATLSLRQAIEVSNGTLPIASLTPTQSALVVGPLATPNTIDFSIVGIGPFVISPTTALPTITSPVVIDGHSQPGFGGPGLAIEIDGANAPAGANGLLIRAGDSTVKGLAIGGFPLAFVIPTDIGGNGILLEGAAGDLIEGNYIGLDASGTTALPNGGDGIGDINRFDPSTFLPSSGVNTIGGTAAGAGNVISGNLGDGLSIAGTVAPTTNLKAPSVDLVEGNRIGTNAAGTQTLPNFGDGIRENGGGPGTIGGSVAGAGNVISGNQVDGLLIGGTSVNVFITSDDLVEGNRIGTDAAGTQALPNGDDGLVVYSTVGTIGGTAAGAGNVIAGNQSDGIAVIGQSNAPAASGASILVEGNVIGAAADGIAPLPNGGDGVNFTNTAGASTVGGQAAGAGNLIANNGGSGVALSSRAFGTYLISGNSIDANGKMGIDRPQYPPDLPLPVIASAGSSASGTVIAGTIAAGQFAAVLPYTIEFFSNTTADPSGFGQGQAYLGSVTITTNDIGNGSFRFTTPADLTGRYVTATATYLGVDTSGFSRDALATTAPPMTTPTTTTLTTPSPFLNLGQAATFVATVNSAAGVPTGSVEFLAFGAIIGTVPLDANGEATFVTGPLLPALYSVTAVYTGDDSHAPSRSAAVSVTVPSPVSLAVLGPNRVATQGRPITFSVAITSSLAIPGYEPIFLFEDGVPVGSAIVGGGVGNIVNITTSELSPGPHVITAAYVGDVDHLPSTPANAVAVQVFAAHAFGGPAVTSDVFTGPKAVTVAFNRGLMVGPAEDLANYKLVGPHHKAISIASAVYNPVNASVTLTTEGPLDPRESYELTINGQSGDRVVDVFGIPLNGKAKGKPGHNYSGKIQVKKAPVVKVAHPKAPSKPKAHASAAHEKGH